MTKLLFYITLVLILSNCKAQSNEDIEIKNILTRMVDGHARPLPPPPPIGSGDTIVSEKVMDSLRRIKLLVAIHPVVGSRKPDDFANDLPKTYKELVRNSTGKVTGLSEIHIDPEYSRHKIVFADTLELKKSIDFENYDLLFTFSNFYFNDDFTRAVFEMGVSRSRLAGGAAVYCLKRENGEWHIEHGFSTTIW